MQRPSADQRARGLVVAHVPDPNDHASEHERASLLEFARRLAALRGQDLAGVYDPQVDYGCPLYFVPSSTLTREQAEPLGIAGPDDLFGGVVPHAFVGGKAISHPLVAPDAAAPPGWDPQLADHVGDAVLAGFAAFCREDARIAGQRLLAHGPVRLKPVQASGGHGQTVARDEGELDAQLDAMDAAHITIHGLVLEENLQDVRTMSVGQVRVADLEATYFGFQRLTTNHRGEEVFGGSDLRVVRGGFDELLAQPLDDEIRHAVAQARRYDAAVRARFGCFYASRSNYDVLLGRDAQGAWRSAVLEQSWRVGGATGAELAALEVFRSDPGCCRVRAACVEVFGGQELPTGAILTYDGHDPKAGRLTKYTVIVPDVDAR